MICKQNFNHFIILKSASRPWKHHKTILSPRKRLSPLKIPFSQGLASCSSKGVFACCLGASAWLRQAASTAGVQNWTPENAACVRQVSQVSNHTDPKQCPKSRKMALAAEDSILTRPSFLLNNYHQHTSFISEA
jgi:hypothetical protein